MNNRTTVIDLDERLATEEQIELTALIIGRDISSYLLAVILQQHGYSVALLSRSQVSVMSDLQESIILKSLHEAAKCISSIDHLSHIGFQIDFDSNAENFDWHQLIDKSRKEFFQLREKIENVVSSKQIPIYEGLIVIIEDDIVRIISEDERSQYAVLRTKYLFVGSDVCHAVIKDQSKSFSSSTVLKTLVDLMKIDQIPKSLAVIGGGIIGSSVASCIKMLGCSRVILIEEQSHCFNGFNGFNDVDREIAAYLESDLIKQDIEIMTNCKINYVNDTACYTANNLIETDYRLIAVGTRRVRNTFINKPSVNIIQLIERVSYGRKIQMGTEINNGNEGTTIQSKIPMIPIDYQRVRGACSIKEAMSIAYRTICQCFKQPKPTFFMPSLIYTVPSVLLIGQTCVPADNMFICRIYFPPTIKYASDKPPRGFGKLWIFRPRPFLCGVQMISEYAEILGKAFGILIRNRIPLDELCNRIEIPGSIGEAIQLMIKQALDQIQRDSRQ